MASLLLPAFWFSNSARMTLWGLGGFTQPQPRDPPMAAPLRERLSRQYVGCGMKSVVRIADTF